MLAVLIGVNAGPNLTYTGSLATLLWRRVLHERDSEPALVEFLRLGALTVPPVARRRYGRAVAGPAGDRMRRARLGDAEAGWEACVDAARRVRAT